MNTDRTLNVGKNLTRLDRTVKNWKWWAFFPLAVILLFIAIVINVNVTIAKWHFSAWNRIDRWVSESLSPLMRWLNSTNKDLF